MQKKSESWCSWLVSGIKSLICPCKRKYLSKLPKNQFNSIIKYLDAKSLLALKHSNKKKIKNKIDELNEDTQEYDTKKCF